MNSDQSELSEEAAAVISQLDEATSRRQQACAEAKQQYHAACLQARREEKAALEGRATKLAALAKKSEKFGQQPFPVVVPSGDWCVIGGFDGRATLKPRPAGRKPRSCNSEKMIEGRAVEGRDGYEYQVCPGEWTAIVNTGGRALLNPKRGPKLSQGVNRLRMFLAFCLSMVSSAASRPGDRPKGSATPIADSPPDQAAPPVAAQSLCRCGPKAYRQPSEVPTEEHARLPERPVASSPPEKAPAPAESQKEKDSASSFIPQEIKSRAHSGNKIFAAPAPKKKTAALFAPLGFTILEPDFSPAKSQKPVRSKSSAGKSSPKSSAKPRAPTSSKTSAGQPSPKSKVTSGRSSPKAEAPDKSSVAAFSHSSCGTSGKSSCLCSSYCTGCAGCASRSRATGDDNESELFDSVSTMGIFEPPARYQTGNDNTSLKPEKLRALGPAPSIFSQVGAWLGLGSKLLNLFRKRGNCEDSVTSRPWRIPSGARPKAGAEDGAKGTLSEPHTKAEMPGVKDITRKTLSGAWRIPSGARPKAGAEDGAKGTLSEPHTKAEMLGVEGITKGTMSGAEGLKAELPGMEGSTKKILSGAWRIPAGARSRTFESLSPQELADIGKAKRRMDMAEKRTAARDRRRASASAADEEIPGNSPASLCSAL